MIIKKLNIDICIYDTKYIKSSNSEIRDENMNLGEILGWRRGLKRELEQEAPVPNHVS